jgi:translation initiation factor eIF-2B subunit beta
MMTLRPSPLQVIVAETSPSHDGHATAAALAAAGIATTLIADCAVFAMMARVNKVSKNRPEV